ncbi:MAG TPA: molybdopterin cofactor-binding domain-containing protein [Burkholderiales bacterium]|nr:molybdopterin cofactor-binding domain-containing protein [Burkholderiales bacterium]
MSTSRRDFLKRSGALVVSFGIPVDLLAQAGGPAPAQPAQTLDAWLAVAPDGRVTAFCGKVELGTGVETAIAQLVADELDVAFERVSVVMGDTERCPNQGPTVGSQSIYRAGPQIRQAAADARQTLLEMAAGRLGAAVGELTVRDGVIATPGGNRITYGELLGGKPFDAPLSKRGRLKTAAEMNVIGKPIARVDLPGKVYGTHPYIQNVRVPGMLHGRVVRPPLVGATLAGVDPSSVAGLPGNVRVVAEGNFVGVAADREEQAIAAARTLKVNWKNGTELPEPAALPAAIKAAPAMERAVQANGDVDAALATAAKTLSAEYFVPFQMHGSIGPSCAVADVRPDGATLWSPTQSSFLTRDSVATLLRLPPDKVRLIWVEGSGCYGHNGADDVTGDAAFLSQALGKPVRVQWMRADEHGREPKGPAMVMTVRGGLDAKGYVVAWDYRVFSQNHSSRPSGAAGGNLLAGAELGLPEKINVVGADRNSKPTYSFPNDRVRLSLLNAPVLRASALRGLGSPQNTFANESFIDELAAAAGVDPIAFRLRHLKDPRAIAVLEEVAKLARWDPGPGPKGDRSSGAGRGAAFVQYDNHSGYVGMVVDVHVDRASGKVRVERVYVAHDCGLVVNPDGVRNQIEGNVVQTLSRALFEEVKFDRHAVTALDWASYPILRFSDAPEEIRIALINRPDQPSLGAGEPAAAPVFAAVANAIFDATGARLRSVPFTPERVKAALG